MEEFEGVEELEDDHAEEDDQLSSGRSTRRSGERGSTAGSRSLRPSSSASPSSLSSSSSSSSTPVKASRRARDREGFAVVDIPEPYAAKCQRHPLFPPCAGHLRLLPSLTRAPPSSPPSLCAVSAAAVLPPVRADDSAALRSWLSANDFDEVGL